ncbi:MAG: hypothetical protein COT84_01375 [Chlamydiae bacterium CG10_big_fil_rev_8_21_14_0_10_35_9]|nr:MAG: hypothetical protein COT84_01375 [Chlamydiae bacterium CG10_big_fil_rev_8_21_14_0_10_35_9]
MFSNYNSSIYTNTPKPLKIIIALSVVLTLLCSIVKPFIPLLGLSVVGFLSGQYWQIFSFTFLQPEAGIINFSSILHLFLYMAVIWTAGNEIIKIKSSSTFLTLYFSSALISGLATLGFMHLFQNYTIAFGLPLIATSLITGWVMLNPFSRIYLFHSFPVQISHLASAFLLIRGLSLLSDEQYSEFFSTLTIIIFSYLYSLIMWKNNGPFKKWHKLEDIVIRLFQFKIRRKKANIYDINEERKNRNFF